MIVKILKIIQELESNKAIKHSMSFLLCVWYGKRALKGPFPLNHYYAPLKWVLLSPTLS